MDKIIALVVSIVLVLGLIAFAVMPQVIGVREAGDTALADQSKMNIVLSNSDYVTGSTVKRYIQTRRDKGIANGGKFAVVIKTSDSTEMPKGEEANIADNAIFTEIRSYDANGVFNKITFTLVNLEQN